MHDRSSRAWIPLLFAILIPASCQQAGSPTDPESSADPPSPEAPASPTSAVTVLLTDDPADLVHAWVNITQVYLQGGPSGDGRTVLFEGPTGMIDLLTLTDDAIELVAGVEIPSGRYAQLRVVVDGIAVETEDGQVFATNDAEVPGGLEPDGTIVCPSCSASGFKVLLQNEDLSLLSDATLTLDFDAAESFVHPAGHSGRWIVHPVIKLSDIVTIDD